MKVICLVLCLGVAHGHIFPRQRYAADMDSLIIQPLDYVEQYQDLTPYQRNEQYKQDQHMKQTRDRQSNEYTLQERDSRQEKRHNRHEGHNHAADSTSNESNSQERYQQQQQQQQQRYYKQLSRDSQEQKEQLSRKQKRNQVGNKPYSSESTSKEDSQETNKQAQKYNQRLLRNSQEQMYNQKQVDSNERYSAEYTKNTRNDYMAPRYADVQKANVRARNVERYNEEEVMAPAHADPISWKGVQIAVDSKSTVDKNEIEKIFNEAYKTIKPVSEEKKNIFHQAYEAAAHKENEDSHLTAIELLQKNQYDAKEHTIKTDDGYLLTLVQIKPKDSTLTNKPVVFLMHGLLGSADDWLLMGPRKSLAYLLADAGYDVWLGNARGSKYSRRHVSKHEAQSDFWQFCNDEIALHDLPAMIDYALKTSNQQKLYYVGYSSGTTVFFSLAAARPEYNDKIIMMYALSPMAYMSNVRSPMLRMIAPTSPFAERLHQQLGHGQFKPNREMVRTVGGAMLENEIGCRNVSSNVNFAMSGVNVDNMDVELIPVIMHHLPAGASTRQIKQYAQAVASRDFTKYNFGAEMNQKVYGERLPPKYDIQKVQTPIALYYSEDDWMASPKDVKRLEKELPNVKDSYKVPIDHFSHMDFQFSKQAPEVVYQRLIDSIQKQESQQNYVY